MLNPKRTWQPRCRKLSDQKVPQKHLDSQDEIPFSSKNSFHKSAANKPGENMNHKAYWRTLSSTHSFVPELWRPSMLRSTPNRNQ